MERLISWVEIPVINFERAVDFYSSILSTELKTEESGEEMKAFLPGNEGVLFRKSGFAPSKNGVIINLNVGSKMDAAIKLIKQKGGTIIREKTRINPDQSSCFALFTDTEGNRLGLNGE